MTVIKDLSWFTNGNIRIEIMNRVQRHVMNCLYATTAIILFTAVASPASAGQPMCPCWDGQIGLAADLASGTYTTCDTHPVTAKKDAILVQSASASNPAAGEKVQSASAALIDGSGSCRFTPAGPPEIGPPTATDTQTTWACIRDISAVCRGFGF